MSDPHRVLRRRRGPVQLALGVVLVLVVEALLLNVKIEELPTTRNLRGAQIRRALLGNQLYQLESLSGGDAQVDATIEGLGRDLGLIDQALARAKADPTEATLRAETDRMRPAIRRVIVHVKQLYDAKEQGFVGALSGALNARKSSERLLVGLVAAPAGPQGLRPGVRGPDRRGGRAQGGRAGPAGQ